MVGCYGHCIGRGGEQLAEEIGIAERRGAPTEEAAAERAKELNEQLLRHKHLYYNEAPEISDAEYDALEAELAQLLERHPQLAPASDDATQLVGASPQADFEKVRHERQMLSLDKVHTLDDLDSFLDRFPGESFALWPKFDGVSLSLVYRGGRLDRAATRGDGTIGELITENARRINGVRAQLDQAIDCEIRGEVVMKRSDWSAYNKANPKKAFANPRNAVSGSLRLKDPNEVSKRPMTFYAYDMIIEPGLLEEGTIAAQLEQLGFETQRYSESAKRDQIHAYISKTEQARAGLDYEIDGVVVRLANPDLYEAAGVTSHHPRGAMAYKMAAEIGQTTLEDVIWQVGKSGAVAPVAQITPLLLAGTTIRRASLHNLEIIKARDIRIGDRIKIKRAGDVIPHVIGPVDPDARDGSEQPITAPSSCPSCGSQLEADESGFIYCRNTLTCPAQRHRRLIHWGGRSAADVDALGQSWLEKFAEVGLVSQPSDLYAISESDLIGDDGRPKFEGMGKKLARKLLDSIESSKQVGLRRALIGMSIPLASEGTAKRLCRAGYESIEEVAQASVEELCKVEDIGPAVAESLHTHLNRPEIQDEITKLRTLGVNLDVADEDRPISASTTSQLNGKRVVITGTLEGVSRKEMEARVEAAGGKASGSVSKNTDYVVCGEKAGSKKAKAEKLGVPIIDQAQLEAMLASA